MKKSTSDIYKFVYKNLHKASRGAKRLENINNYLRETYNFPDGFALDVIKQTKEEGEVTSQPFWLFVLTDSIIETKTDKGFNLNDFFTDNEIKQFRKQKYIQDVVFFPMRIPMIQVNDDQWVGMADVEWFMRMRRSGMIKYNINTQRPLTRKLVNGKYEEYIITKSVPAIKGIRELYHSHDYISNDIILNMNPEIGPDYKYDEEKRRLIIYELDHFDIIDGYNRYTGMYEEKDEYSNFQENFVLQIMCFPTEKAQQYIYQQDLKIKMRKVDSNSMNNNDYGNIISDQLNRMGLWKGKIGHNKVNGVTILISDLSLAINTFYIKDENSMDRQKAYRIAKEINNKINDISYDTNSNYDLLDILSNELSLKEIAIIIYFISKIMTKDTNDLSLPFKVIEKIKDVPVAKIIHAHNRIKYISNKDIKYIEQLFSDERGDNNEGKTEN